MTMRNLVTCTLALGLAVGALAACGEQRESVREGRDYLPAVGLDEQLVFVELVHDEGYALDLSGDPPVGRARRFELPIGPIAMLRRNAHNELLVLCEGRRGSAKEQPEGGALALVDSDLEVRAYQLGNPFDAIRQSADGRFVLIFRQDTSQRLLNNRNAVAVVDLDRAPDEAGAVTVLTLDGFGTPRDVVFSPSMQIAGEARRLAVILSERSVALFDLNHLGEGARRETTVELSGEAGASIQPTQVLFGSDEPTLYVRGTTSDDVFVFRLAPQEGNEGGNDFRPSINQLGAGRGPRDMALFDYGSGPRLLVAAENSSEAVVIEASSSRTTSLALDHPASRVLLYETSDGQARPHALLYQPGSPWVSFLALEDVEERTNRNLDALRMDLAVGQVVPLLDEGLALILHGTTGVSLLDLDNRTVSPISANEVLNDAVFDTAARRLWIGPPNQPWLGFLDVHTGQTGEVLLDENIEEVVPMFELGLLAAIHDSHIGHVTVVPTGEPSRESAHAFQGFLFEEVLQ